MANKIILTGRTTKNAELSYLPGVGTPKMAFSLAVEIGRASCRERV